MEDTIGLVEADRDEYCEKRGNQNEDLALTGDGPEFGGRDTGIGFDL